ncbi:hypothetical protein [Novosphingobium sp. Fuku2-ISO-50]|uniref:hypothetical protein n=1 Tax=Novosphingobium sp. Fuku2-ISO-50 TaxID=1739114 RepID=UPI0012E3873F|nr:hypothetical protein [Novosphingobium sp. Fuku2-ISO-50]
MPKQKAIEPRLPSVLPPEEASLAGQDDGPNDPAVQENLWLDRSLSKHKAEAAALRNDLARAYIENLNADRELRKKYASQILLYLEFYSATVGAIIILSGLSFIKIDTNVLQTLVGSTAVAAIGLVGFIARGLFRSSPPPPGN